MIIDKSKKYLFIVESPNKKSTISNIFKKCGYDNITVVASVGHITHLADTGEFNLGLDTKNDFKPNYEIAQDKKQVVAKLKELVKSNDEIILASDEDREGEAIAYHLLEELKIPKTKYQRVTYHSVTKDAILEGIKNSRKIDMNLVNSALAREAADKIIGYRLSGIARNQTGAKSVGRCQSVGLKLIVDREKEIKKFIPEVYYELFLKFNLDDSDYVARYIGTEEIKVENFKCLADVQKVMDECNKNNSNYIIKNIAESEKKIYPKPPFTTSSYQQDCINKLGMSSEKATYCAQKLFEGVKIKGEHKGLITYIRTDSSDVAPEFAEQLKQHVLDKFGSSYYTPIIQGKKKVNAQEAHEAIRPVDLEMTPEKLSEYIEDNDLLRVYKLIYNRTLAASMSPAIYSIKNVTINNEKNLFQLSLSKIKFEGFKKVYDEMFEEDKVPELNFKLSVGDKLPDNAFLEYLIKETTPPRRFGEGSIIKKLEDLGIGRPSTYNTIVKTLKDKNRGFCEVQNKAFIPTELGINTSEFLDKSFSSVINLDYTAKLEETLDEIAKGKEERVNFLNAFYKNLEEDIDKVDVKINQSRNTNSMNKEVKICPDCGAQLVVKKGPYSLFWACPNYPKCKHTESMYRKQN